MNCFGDPAGAWPVQAIEVPRWYGTDADNKLNERSPPCPVD